MYTRKINRKYVERLGMVDHFYQVSLLRGVTICSRFSFCNTLKAVLKFSQFSRDLTIGRVYQ